MSPRLPAGVRIQVWWNWRASHFAIHHYSTPSDALPTPPGAQGYETLTHLRIPYGFHAPLGRDVHHSALLQPGIDKPQLDLVYLPRGDVQMGMQPFTLTSLQAMLHICQRETWLQIRPDRTNGHRLRWNED